MHHATIQSTAHLLHDKRSVTTVYVTTTNMCFSRKSFATNLPSVTAYTGLID